MDRFNFSGTSCDILVVSDLEAVTIDQVYTDGILVAQGGQLIVEIPAYEYPAWAVHSLHLEPLTVEDFSIPAKQSPAKVRMMRVIPGMVHTEEEIVEMQPNNGELVSDPNRDILKAAVFYRHEPQSARRSQGFGFVSGTQLTRAAPTLNRGA